MAPKRKQNKPQRAKKVKPGVQHTRDESESKLTINDSNPQTPTTTISVKGKRSFSSVEIKQEIKREGTGDAGAKKFRSEGREGNDTDSKSQGVSQPDHGMNVADTASPVHSDITGQDHNDHDDTGNVDHEAMEIEIAEAESEVARIDAELAKMEAKTARNDAHIAEQRKDIAINNAEIFRNEAKILVLVKENAWHSERIAKISEENRTMDVRCAEMVEQIARTEVRNANMGTILHIAKGDVTLVAMSRVGFDKARLTAQKLVQVREAMECIYRAGRRPTDEEVEDVLQKAKRLRAPL